MPAPTPPRRSLLLVVLLAGVLLTGCGSNNFRDVEGVESKDPDSIELFNNLDQHPNLVKICIRGVAFVTANRDYKPFERVPEWDKTCPGGSSQ